MSTVYTFETHIGEPARTGSWQSLLCGAVNFCGKDGLCLAFQKGRA